jgi:hypothetical protein
MVTRTRKKGDNLIDPMRNILFILEMILFSKQLMDKYNGSHVMRFSIKFSLAQERWINRKKHKITAQMPMAHHLTDHQHGISN